MTLLTANEVTLASQSMDDGVRRSTLSLPGMHCGGCLSRIEKAVGVADGVLKVRANLAKRSVQIDWLDSAGPESFLQQITGLGYEAILPVAANADACAAELRSSITAMAVAGFAAANVMMLSVSVWSGADEHTRQLFHWVSALITIPAIAYSARIFYSSAWRALRVGTTNMDVPITIGITLSCALGLYDTLMQNERVYFEAAIMLVFFLLIGRTLDYLMRQRAARSLDGLRALESTGAYVLSSDGTEEYVAATDLQVGNRIRVAAGARIPADGHVFDGVSDVDTALVNGESTPQTVKQHACVLSGTLNLTSELIIDVSHAVQDSFLASMQKMVQHAEQSKGPYQQIADRAARWYAPVVHSAAILAFALWLWIAGDWHTALTIAVSVLVITCPCALALAVPMVQVVAAQRLFTRGVLMKNGTALEKLADVRCVVFDKTGTLTKSEPLASRIADTNAASAIAQTMAKHSEHPYARAIAALPVDNKANFNDVLRVTADFNFNNASVSELPGLGLEVRCGDQQWRLGKRNWAVSGMHVDGSSGMVSNRPVSVLSVNGRAVEAFEFNECIRDHAATAVTRLKAAGIDTEILSGDTAVSVNRIAALIGINTVVASALPEDKLLHVQHRQDHKRNVLMVGDGLNDCPAMAAAHVSLAPGNAATTGRNSADFVFLNNSLQAIPDTLSISSMAQKLVRQNFCIALLYNLIALPAAFAGLVTPLVAAIAMSTSSLLVIANALRLHLYEPDKTGASESFGQPRRSIAFKQA